MYNANDNVHLKTKFIMLILQLSLTLQMTRCSRAKCGSENTKQIDAYNVYCYDCKRSSWVGNKIAWLFKQVL